VKRCTNRSRSHRNSPPPACTGITPHPHGESFRQALDACRAPIVVEGIDSATCPKCGDASRARAVVRGRDIEHDPQAASLRRQVAMSDTPCGASTEMVERG